MSLSNYYVAQRDGKIDVVGTALRIGFQLVAIGLGGLLAYIIYNGEKI